jgi:hypothetical protein
MRSVFLGLGITILMAACGGQTTVITEVSSESGGGGEGSGAPTTNGMTGASGVMGTSGATGATGAASSGSPQGSGASSSGETSSGALDGGSSAMSGSLASQLDASEASVDAADAGLGYPSPGCAAAQVLPGATDTWVRQPEGCDRNSQASCQAIPPGTEPSTTPVEGAPEWRGWWVWIPSSYDPTKPTPVIYNAAGCDDQDIFNAGNASYNFDKDVPGANAIVVGLDYDTYTDISLCYDTINPDANDYTFFPWLMGHIENEFCVDMSREFMAGYHSGGALTEQLGCAFADHLRAEVSVAAGESTSDGLSVRLPTCVSHPIAAMFVHDITDTTEPYAYALPACSNALVQNGCSVTNCSNPRDETLTTAYPVPPGVTLPQDAVCRQVNGCPVDYPVVFCTTVGLPSSENDANWGVDKMSGTS